MARHPDLESLIHQNLRQEFFGTVATPVRPRTQGLDLPRASAWILKVVQAATVGRSPSLEVQQTPTDTRFSFAPQGDWADLAENLQEGLAGPPHQQALLVALGCLIETSCHPFLLALPGGDQALFWTGLDMRPLACKAEPGLNLTVSHRRLAAGYVSAPMSSSETARHNAQLLAELSGSAFTCPIPLTVDRRRLDALQACRSHGYSAHNLPVRLGWVQSNEAPAMPVPPATLQGYQPEETVDPRLALLLRTDPQQASIAGSCLISLHLALVQDGQKRRWRPQPQECRFYWVEEGVIVAEEALDFPPLAVSCAVFASAQGLPMAGELALASSEAREHRREHILLAFLPLIQDTKISLPALIGSRKGRTNLVGTVVMGGGALLTLASPLVGLIVVGTGGLVLAAAASGEKQLQSDLQKQFGLLQTYWEGRAILAPSES